jgi:hypothetical protein
MRLGILETVGLAGSLVFAVPVGLFGVESLLAGRTTLGAGLLVVAVLMVVLPRRLTTPSDVPVAVAERVVGGAVGDPDEDDE